MITKYIDMAEVSNGAMMGELFVRAEGWSTRYSWGHRATILVDNQTEYQTSIRYYNRTWERYTFESVLHSVFSAYVKAVFGVDVHKPLSKRDATPCKNADAENRRLIRVANKEFAKTIYNNLCNAMEGKPMVKPSVPSAMAS